VPQGYSENAVDAVVPSPEGAEGVKSPEGARIGDDGKADGKSDAVEIPSPPETPRSSELGGVADSTTVTTVKFETPGDTAEAGFKNQATVAGGYYR